MKTELILLHLNIQGQDQVKKRTFNYIVKLEA
jgi:hypothetical protein